MLTSMSALNPLAGGLALSQFQGLGSLGGLSGLGGLNLGGMGNNPSLQNLGQGMNPNSLGQGFPPQGLGVGGGLGGLIPNLQNLQALQALQSLGKNIFYKGGLMNPNGLGGLQNGQLQVNPSMNDLMRSQYEQAK